LALSFNIQEGGKSQGAKGKKRTYRRSPSPFQ
jgi:hypothetical protein